MIERRETIKVTCDKCGKSEDRNLQEYTTIQNDAWIAIYKAGEQVCLTCRNDPGSGQWEGRNRYRFVAFFGVYRAELLYSDLFHEWQIGITKYGIGEFSQTIISAENDPPLEEAMKAVERFLKLSNYDLKKHRNEHKRLVKKWKAYRRSKQC